MTRTYPEIKEKGPRPSGSLSEDGSQDFTSDHFDVSSDLLGMIRGDVNLER